MQGECIITFFILKISIRLKNLDGQSLNLDHCISRLIRNIDLDISEFTSKSKIVNSYRINSNSNNTIRQLYFKSAVELMKMCQSQ